VQETEQTAGNIFEHRYCFKVEGRHQNISCAVITKEVDGQDNSFERTAYKVEGQHYRRACAVTVGLAKATHTYVYTV